MEIYFSTDVETDGPIPGDNSMLSLGSAAFTSEGKLIGTFYRTLHTIYGANGDPDTMKWWAENKEAYEETRKNVCHPLAVMQDFVNWVNDTSSANGGKPVFVGYPAGFDFLFVYWYMIHHGLKSPFSFSALDIKTYAMAMLKKGYRDSTKRNMPSRWFSGSKHTHVAVDDAIEQGELFCNMLKENSSK